MGLAGSKLRLTAETRSARRIRNELTEKVVELKVVDTLRPIHQAQLLSYLKLGGWTMGLLINFNVPVLAKGIKRVVLNYRESSAISAPRR